MTEPQHEELTQEQLRAINQIAREFERDLRSGDTPSVRRAASQVGEATRRHLARELLRLHMEYGLETSKELTLDGYLSEFPDEYDELIRSAYSDVVGDDGREPAVPSTQEHETVLLFSDQTKSTTGQTEEPSGNNSPTKSVSNDSNDFPRWFGRYQLLRLLGQGGMGAVYLARDDQLDRLVALKVPDLDRRPDRRQAAKDRFHREARSMATAEHPNLCPIHDVGEADGCPVKRMDAPT